MRRSSNIALLAMLFLTGAAPAEWIWEVVDLLPGGLYTDEFANQNNAWSVRCVGESVYVALTRDTAGAKSVWFARSDLVNANGRVWEPMRRISPGNTGECDSAKAPALVAFDSSWFCVVYELYKNGEGKVVASYSNDWGVSWSDFTHLTGTAARRHRRCRQ